MARRLASRISPGQLSLGLAQDPAAILGLLLDQLRAAGHRGRLVPEMGLCQGEVRVDLAAIDDHLDGYEIKSDRDDLRRLPVQAAAYSAVFDRMTLVAANRHIDVAGSGVPEWWGLSVVDGTDRVLRTVRPAAPNPGTNPHAVVRLLWRDEAAAIVEARTGRTMRSTRTELWRRIVDEVPPDELGPLVCACLRTREGWRAAG